MAKSKKLLGGCGIGCLAVIAIVVAIGFFSYRFVMGQLNEFADKGWKRELGQVIVVSDPPVEETYYFASTVTISADVDKEIGIIAQSAVLSGTFSERVYFRGQSIIIDPQAHLQKGLDVRCQIVDQQGRVDGEITGEYATLNTTSATSALESTVEEAVEQPAPAN